MTRKKKRTTRFTSAVLGGCLVGALVTSITCERMRWSRWRLEFEPGMAVSGKQIRRVASAIKKHQAEHGARPRHLEELLADKRLAASDLFDARRKSIPTIDSATGRLATRPDVLYLAALRKKDPGDLILLCTILLHEPDENYHVIRNDGQYVRMGYRNLTNALNRTYWHLGAKLR